MRRGGEDYYVERICMWRHRNPTRCTSARPAFTRHFTSPRSIRSRRAAAPRPTCGHSSVRSRTPSCQRGHYPSPPRRPGLEQQPHDRLVALLRRMDERREAVIILRLLVRPGLEQQPHDRLVAVPRRNDERRVAVIISSPPCSPRPRAAAARSPRGLWPPLRGEACGRSYPSRPCPPRPRAAARSPRGRSSPQ